MSVDIKQLKQLRSMTHAPLKDCKEALEESGGDLEKAQEYLREKGAAKAAKKSDRATNEGVVMIKESDDKVAGVILACETDFVAKNETFRELADWIADRLLEEDSFETYDELDDAVKEEIDKKLKDNFVTIGENMQVEDAFVATGQRYIYRHPGDKVASVVFYEGEADRAKDVALQVAAMGPDYLSVEDVPEATVSELEDSFKEELKESGKPADIIDKIVAGKLNKEWSELVLLEQQSIVDDSKKVKEALGDTTVTRYIRYAIE